MLLHELVIVFTFYIGIFFFFCLCCCFLLPLNVRSFYLNETISKHFYTRVESGTYLFSDSYLLPVNISQPQDLPDESRVCSALLFRSLIKNWIKCEGQSLSANCNGCVWREFSKGSLFSSAQALEHPHKSRKIISSTWTKNPKMGKCVVERLSEMLLLPQSSQCWLPKPASSFCLNTPLTAHAKSWAASPSACNLSSPDPLPWGQGCHAPPAKAERLLWVYRGAMINPFTGGRGLSTGQNHTSLCFSLCTTKSN